MKFNPYKKKGGGGSFSHAERGVGRNRFGIGFLRKLDVVAILKGGAKKGFRPSKEDGEGGGGVKTFTLS